MNVQSRIRDLDATGARPKSRQGWVARHRASAFLLLLGLIALAGGYYWYTAGSSAAGKPVIVAATRADVEDVVTAGGHLQARSNGAVVTPVSRQLETLPAPIVD